MKANRHTLHMLLGFMALFACEYMYAADAPNTVDVTTQVRQAVKGNSLSIRADTNVLGDPVPSTQKRLKVEYTINNVANSKVVMEGALLEVRPPTGARLAVTKAVYGDLTDEKKVDVTAAVAASARGNKLSLPVNNETMGGDPASTTVKTLAVTYFVGGKAGKATAGEFTTLSLPSSSDGTGKLIILSAIYGDL